MNAGTISDQEFALAYKGFLFSEIHEPLAQKAFNTLSRRDLAVAVHLSEVAEETPAALYISDILGVIEIAKADEDVVMALLGYLRDFETRRFHSIVDPGAGAFVIDRARVDVLLAVYVCRAVSGGVAPCAEVFITSPGGEDKMHAIARIPGERQPTASRGRYTGSKEVDLTLYENVYGHA